MTKPPAPPDLRGVAPDVSAVSFFAWRKMKGGELLYIYRTRSKNVHPEGAPLEIRSHVTCAFTKRPQLIIQKQFQTDTTTVNSK